jgi:hypothetical protein
VNGFLPTQNPELRFHTKETNEAMDDIDTRGVKPAAFWLAMTMILTVSAVALTVALYGVLR